MYLTYIEEDLKYKLQFVFTVSSCVVCLSVLQWAESISADA